MAIDQHARHRPVRSRVRDMARAGVLALLSGKQRLTPGGGRLAEVPRVYHLYFHGTPGTQLEKLHTLLDRLSSRVRFASLSHAMRDLATGRVEGPVVTFTFDDGFASNRSAADLLARYGVRGTFYICTGLVGGTREDALRLLPTADPSTVETPLRWGELREMHEQGHEIGSHTITHLDLAQASDDELYHEVGSSREHLLAEFGSCDHFAWPFGTLRHARRMVLDACADAGYRTCASTVRGSHAIPPADDVAVLRREHVRLDRPLYEFEYFLHRAAERTEELTRESLPG